MKRVARLNEGLAGKAGGPFAYRFAPASVTRLQMSLA